MRTNEFLAELSNEKLAKYKTAASADATKADSEGDFKKGDKRFKGINTATKKQFDNDAKKIDEGVQVDPEQIQQIFKGAQNIQSAGGAANLVGGGNNRTAIGKIKDMVSKPNPVAAPGLKQSTSTDPSVSAAEQPTTPAAKAAQLARQQRQAAATARLNQPLGSTSVPDKNSELPVRNADNTRIRTGDMSASTKPNKYDLSESQVYRLISKIVNHHKKQVDEGIIDWIKTKAQNLTNKITADKLLQAWNKAGKPTDSDQIADVMVKAGVPQETLTSLFTNFKLPAPHSMQTATQGTGSTPTSIPAATSGISTGMSAAGGNRGYAPSSGRGAPAATTSAGIPSFRTIADAKDAIDDVLDGLNSLKRRNRTVAVSYGASEFGKLAQQNQQAPAQQSQQAPAQQQAQSKQPKPANLRVSGGNPGAPTPDEQANLERRIQQATNAPQNESVGLPYPGTYEQTNDMFKGSGQRRVAALTNEEELDENCWKGYHKEGNKKMFGKTVPNCVKNEGVADDSEDTVSFREMVDVVDKHYPKYYAELSGSNISDKQFEQKITSAYKKIMQKQGVAEGETSTPAIYVKGGGKYPGMTIAPKGWTRITDIKDEGDSYFVMVGNDGDGLNIPKDKVSPHQIKLKNGMPITAKQAFMMFNGWTPDREQGVTEGDLNELSTGLLKRYKKQAQRDIDTTDDAGIYNDTDIDRIGRRTTGITRATSKIKSNNKKEPSVAEGQHSCPHCGGEMVSEELMNEKKDACYYKVKSRYKVWPSAYASGALVKCRKKGADSWGDGGKKNESSILEGIERADENLHKWFKEKWVRFGPDGKIRGDCARGDDSEGKPKCLPQSKAQNLGKKGRASAASRKRREDPNPERSGKAINVNTKKETKG